MSLGPQDAGWSPQELALGREALARGLVTREQLAAATRRAATLRAAGMPCDLLAALSPVLAPPALAAVRALAAGTLAAGGRGPQAPGPGPAAPGPGFATVAPMPAPAPAPGGPATPGSDGARPSGRPGDLSPGARVGGYQIVRALARGGMGAVYVAEQVGAGRQVALKVSFKGLGAVPDRRFDREAESVARLAHPNVVAVHERGEDALGRPFIAMELIEGESLDRRLERTGPLPPGEAARLMLDVARALEHAHAQGVLHRDLKPANVLVRARDGAPLLTDFGLAKVVTAESLTRTGEVLGTPHYMSPEQVSGGRVPVDVRSDVWGLGATLFHLLTGQTPFEGGSLVAVLACVLKGDVVAPSSLAPAVPPALDAIVLRAMTREPAGRYQRMADLATDLERFVHGEDPAAAAAARGRRRARAALALAGGAGALALVAAFAAWALRAPATPAPPAPPRAQADAAGVASPAAPTAADPADLARPPRPDPEAPPARPEAAPSPEAAFQGLAQAAWLPMRHLEEVPAPRYSHSFVWHGAGRAALLFGGHDGKTLFGDTWWWDGATWREAPRGGPSPEPRFCGAVAYDAARGCVVLHGGSIHGPAGPDGSPTGDKAGFGDTWEHDGRRWRRVAGPEVGPGLRTAHRLAYDPKRRRTVQFGGADPRWRRNADLWAWDGEVWKPLEPGPAPGPSPRHDFAMAWDAARDVLVVVGGFGKPEIGELWEWSPDAGWRAFSLEGQPVSAIAGSAAVDTGEGVLLFGGYNGRSLRRGTWVWDGERMTWRLEGYPYEVLPGARRWHGLAWDPERRRAVLFGGYPMERATPFSTWELRLE